MKPVPGGQQNNYIFHVVTEGRTYELLVHDEITMNKYVNYVTTVISEEISKLCYILYTVYGKFGELLNE